MNLEGASGIERVCPMTTDQKGISQGSVEAHEAQCEQQRGYAEQGVFRVMGCFAQGGSRAPRAPRVPNRAHEVRYWTCGCFAIMRMISDRIPTGLPDEP